MTEAAAARAIIFDMDGVISDTQRLHSESEVEALARRGMHCSAHELALRYSGVPDEEMFGDILRRHGESSAFIDELTALKWEFLRQKLVEGIPLIPNIERLIGDALSSGYRLAIASGSPISFIEQVISHPFLRDAFEVVVSSDEVARGKPAPDVFIEAARRLAVCPGDCVVIEDGLSGMEGAKRAGMRCIGVVKDFKKSWPADRLVNSVDEISTEMIAALLEGALR